MQARRATTTTVLLMFGLGGLAIGLGLGAWGGKPAALFLWASMGFAAAIMIGAPVAAIIDVVLFRRDMTPLTRIAWLGICVIGWTIGTLLYFGLGDEKTRRLLAEGVTAA